LLREQYYLDKINPSLNTCKTAGSPLGVKRDVIFSVNLSKARRGKNISKMVNRVRKANIITSETRLKRASRSKGVIVKIYDNSNNFLYQFPNMGSAAKHLYLDRSTIGNIFKTGISYDNYIYKFEVITEHPIIIVNKENNSIMEYYSLREAAKGISVSAWYISKYINSGKLLKDIYLITKKIDKENNIPRVIMPETRLKMASRSKGVIVKVYDKYNNMVNIFSTIRNAAKHYDVSIKTINENLNTNIPYNNLIYKSEITIGHPIIVVNKENNSIMEYYSLREAAKDIDVDFWCIPKYINTNKLLKGIYLITRK